MLLQNSSWELGRGLCLRPESSQGGSLAFPYARMRPSCYGLAASKTLSHSNSPVSLFPSCSSPRAELSWSCPPHSPLARQLSRWTQSGGGTTRASRRGGRQGRGSDRRRRDCVPSAAVSGWRRYAGGLLSHCCCGAAGASTPAPASCGGGKARHPLGQGSRRLSKQPVRFSSGALGALRCHCLVTLCLFRLLPPEIPLDQKLLSHPRTDSGGPWLWQSARSVIITWETSKQQ